MLEPLCITIYLYMYTLQENKNYKQKYNEKRKENIRRNNNKKKRPPTSHYVLVVPCLLVHTGLVIIRNVSTRYEKRDIDGVSGMQKWHRKKTSKQ